MKILICYDYYRPAFRAGGPIRSLVNLADLVKDEIEVFILAKNTDHDSSPLPVVPNKWNDSEGNIQVFYSDRRHTGYQKIKMLISSLAPDLIYVNGLFSTFSFLNPLRVARSLGIPVLISPRGMLQKTSLSQGRLKKALYLKVVSGWLFNDHIHWHFTTQQEMDDFISYYPRYRAHTTLIGNVPAFHAMELPKPVNNAINFGTVALISPMKNYHLILKSFMQVDERINYFILGPVLDQKYWEKCQHLITRLPANINVQYLGEIVPEQVPAKLKKCHYYIQPSRSENFGHSIFEAMSLGIPVITSDQTPWKNLEAKKAGWDVDISRLANLKNAIQQAIDSTASQYEELSSGARKVAEEYIQKSNLKEKYLRLFFSVSKIEN